MATGGESDVAAQLSSGMVAILSGISSKSNDLASNVQGVQKQVKMILKTYYERKQINHPDSGLQYDPNAPADQTLAKAINYQNNARAAQ